MREQPKVSVQNIKFSHKAFKNVSGTDKIRFDNSNIFRQNKKYDYGDCDCVTSEVFTATNEMSFISHQGGNSETVLFCEIKKYKNGTEKVVSARHETFTYHKEMFSELLLRVMFLQLK